MSDGELCDEGTTTAVVGDLENVETTTTVVDAHLVQHDGKHITVVACTKGQQNTHCLYL
jgi:hypothetical protein